MIFELTGQTVPEQMVDVIGGSMFKRGWMKWRRAVMVPRSSSIFLLIPTPGSKDICGGAAKILAMGTWDKIPFHFTCSNGNLSST